MAALNLTIGARFRNNTFKQQTVGAAAAQFTQLAATDPVKKPEQIFVQALSTNSGRITIRNDSGVTAGGAGLELIAGANTVLPGNSASEWYAIGSAAGQVFNIIYSEGAV